MSLQIGQQLGSYQITSLNTEILAAALLSAEEKEVHALENLSAMPLTQRNHQIRQAIKERERD